MPALIRRVYVRQFLISLKATSQYRVHLIAVLVKAPFVLALQYFVWRYFFAQSGSTIGGLSFSAIFVYFAVQQVLNVLQSFPVANTLAQDIQTGRFSLYLARPVSYLPLIFTQYLSQWLIGFASSLLPIVLYFSLSRTVLPVAPVTALTLLGSIALSGVNYFLLESLLGLSAFRFYKILGVKLALNLVFDLFGGKLLPLVLLPPALQSISYLVPTRAIYYEPARLLLEGPSIEGFAVQLIVGAALLVLLRTSWRRGTRIYDGAL